MYGVAILLAVLGALLIAVGAALQERAAARPIPRAVGSPGSPLTPGPAAGRNGVPPEGRIRYFRRLLRDGRWLAGVLVIGLGVALHMVALSSGPVSAVQPVGTAGLLFAVIAKGLLDRTGVNVTGIVGAVAVVLGLAGLVVTHPHRSGTASLPRYAVALLVLGALSVVAMALLIPARRVSRTVKAAVLAAGAGSAFGVAAALVGVIGHRVARGVDAIATWPTVLVVVLLVSGGIAQQYGYRLDRFYIVYAVLLVADPVTASSVGVLVLGDPLPASTARTVGLGLSALVTVVGLVVLARHYRGPGTARGPAAGELTGRACES